MPNLAAFHPQIVHFVIGLLIVGVLLRVVSLTGKLKFTSPAALTLILIGTVAAWFAVKSGVDAHGPVERIPGVRDIVVHHEEVAINTRNVFIVVALIELLAFGMLFKESLARHVRWVYAVSALIGLFGLNRLYEAAEHGGEIVYSYGGGPGLRTGNPEDTERLLLAGLYNQAMADRRAGRKAEASELIATMARRFPRDVTVQLLNAESLLLDTSNLPAAIVAIDATQVPAADARLTARKATIKADILLAMGQPAQARTTLSEAIAALPAEAPQATRLKAKLDSIK
jgi:uncharacterized membrane protein